MFLVYDMLYIVYLLSECFALLHIIHYVTDLPMQAHRATSAGCHCDCSRGLAGDQSERVGPDFSEVKVPVEGLVITMPNLANPAAGGRPLIACVSLTTRGNSASFKSTLSTVDELHRSATGGEYLSAQRSWQATRCCTCPVQSNSHASFLASACAQHNKCSPLLLLD